MEGVSSEILFSSRPIPDSVSVKKGNPFAPSGRVSGYGLSGPRLEGNIPEGVVPRAPFWTVCYRADEARGSWVAGRRSGPRRTTRTTRGKREGRWETLVSRVLSLGPIPPPTEGVSRDNDPGGEGVREQKDEDSEPSLRRPRRRRLSRR